jgi:hypothetical protein
MVSQFGAEDWHRGRCLYPNAHTATGNTADRDDNVFVDENLLAGPTGQD